MNKTNAIKYFFEKHGKGVSIYASQRNGFKGPYRCGWFLSTHENLNVFQYGQLKDDARGRIRVGDWKIYWSSGQINFDTSYNKQGEALREKMWDPNGVLLKDV